MLPKILAGPLPTHSSACGVVERMKRKHILKKDDCNIDRSQYNDDGYHLVVVTFIVTMEIIVIDLCGCM